MGAPLAAVTGELPDAFRQYRCPYRDCHHVGPLGDFTNGKHANECRACERRVKVYYYNGKARVQTW